ncbi:hypothetical protein OIU84_029932 [Salix udensis]|uniref:Sulfotransferase n=1 Tax=Salix udensis TaxID=889485 RepID=A0AAD6P8W0_9ROSI|nr:hypothetical protein OIU84_029932 [Salix udensis]
MAEYICVLNKDSIIIKPAKKTPILLRMIVLLFAMVIERPSPDVDHENLQISSVHYPNPETFTRAECVHNPVRYFAILSMQRSGSGWFETLLNSHVNVSSNGEIFSVLDRRINISSITQTLDKVYNLDWFTSASKNECSAAVGFKWMLNQDIWYCKQNGKKEEHQPLEKHNGKKEEHQPLEKQNGKNLLRRMVSVLANSYDRHAKLLNGTHKSHVHSTEEAETLAKYKPMINSTLHIVLYYEDLIKNPTKLKDVQAFLGLPVMDLTSRQVKIHKGFIVGPCYELGRYQQNTEWNCI